MPSMACCCYRNPPFVFHDYHRPNYLEASVSKVYPTPLPASCIIPKFRGSQKRLSQSPYVKRGSGDICNRLVCDFKEVKTHRMESGMIVHKGGCHCKKVRWEVHAPCSVVAWQCNCSDCSMRGNIHFIVPSDSFKLLGDSKEFLTTYTFGTHTAKHIFCKICGITSFYVPRSNPDGVAVTFKCVDSGTLAHVEIKQFDGRNWEGSYNETGIALCSKVVMPESK